jgi:hypothetical protein
MVQSIHLDLHECGKDRIGSDSYHSDGTIRKYHQDLNFLVGREDSEIMTFLFGGTPEVYGFSSIGLGKSFVADGHYANETNRVFLDVIIEDEQIPSEIATIARTTFRARDHGPFFRVLPRNHSEEKKPEVTLERYQTEKAWGLSNHLDLVADRNINPEQVAHFIHDQIPFTIQANSYEAPKVYNFEGGFSFAQLIDTSAVYGIVKKGRVYLDVFSCKYYSGNNLVALVQDYFGAKDCSVRSLLRK